ncbi:hypothetical protein Tco_0082797 [Tanacetum coccineum]
MMLTKIVEMETGMETEAITEATIQEVAVEEHRTLLEGLLGMDAAYEMPWKTLMKKTTETYCPRSEINKLEIELCVDRNNA